MQEDPASYLFGFAALNLLAVVFRKPLSKLLMIFFAYGRKINPPEELERKAKQASFEGFFSNPQIYKPAETSVRKMITWSGIINAIGCIGLYYLIHKFE